MATRRTRRIPPDLIHLSTASRRYGAKAPQHFSTRVAQGSDIGIPVYEIDGRKFVSAADLDGLGKINQAPDGRHLNRRRGDGGDASAA